MCLARMLADADDPRMWRSLSKLAVTVTCPESGSVNSCVNDPSTPMVTVASSVSAHRERDLATCHAACPGHREGCL